MHTENQDIYEIALDGVRYALLNHGSRLWRLGSSTPLWREEIPLLGQSPDDAALNGLASRGVFAGRGDPSPLAVMCCGLGSAWPGMGRGLYDNFPAAREAMDEIASFAEWNILSLMDEPDLEVINQARNQIPYLFLLEYAQWRQLASLGLRPELICGHSLGELVALCLAGVYDAHAAWLLLDTRARHMASLESNSANTSGMLAVSADFGTVSQILAAHPELNISNCNTPRQYILGGPRPGLLEARKTLRKQRIPAFMLNMGIAFHNPAMRILREISLRRLYALEMKAPDIPMLSCVTSSLYPADKKDVCRYIADLDENTVEWTKSVQAMRGQYNIRNFIELGPRETLCGLVEEIDSGAVCMAANRQGHETEAMRQLCARLFAMGHLERKCLERQKNMRLSTGSANREEPGAAGKTKPAFSDVPEHDLRIILELISEASGKTVASLRPELDLRHDLALRSSRFPRLVQDAERRLGRSIALENMFQIATVGDLARFLAGLGPEPQNAEETGASASQRPDFNAPPLNAFKWLDGDEPQAVKYNPAARGLMEKPHGLIALCVFDQQLLPQIWEGLASFKCSLALPKPLLGESLFLEKYGNTLLALDCSLNPGPGELDAALRLLSEAKGFPTGFLFIPPALLLDCDAGNGCDDFMTHVFQECAAFAEPAPLSPWFCALRRMSGPVLPDSNAWKSFRDAASTFFKRTRAICRMPDCHSIFWLDARAEPRQQNRGECGDMLAKDLLYNSAASSLWLPKTWRQAPGQSYCPASPCLNFVWPDPAPPLPSRAGMFQGVCQYSGFAESSLPGHGGGEYSPADTGEKEKFPRSSWLPVGGILKASLIAGRLAAPWLRPCGFSDVRINNFPVLPEGITRECRLSAIATPWISQAGIMTRICNTDMSVRKISANGRRTQDWKSVCDGACLLARNSGIPPSLSLLDAMPEAGEDCSHIAQICYDLLGFSESWRSLRNFTFHDSGANGYPAYTAEIANPDCRIADGCEWDYNSFIQLVEAIYQASLAALVHAGDAASPMAAREILEQWNYGIIGYLRFDPEKIANCADTKLYLRSSWHDERFARFDARITNNANEPLICVWHMEFEHTGGNS